MSISANAGGNAFLFSAKECQNNKHKIRVSFLAIFSKRETLLFYDDLMILIHFIIFSSLWHLEGQ